MPLCSACQRIDLSETPHSRLQLLRHYPPGPATTGRTLERHAFQCAVCDCVWIKETRNILETAQGRAAVWQRRMQWVLFSRPAPRAGADNPLMPGEDPGTASAAPPAPPGWSA